MTEIVVLINNKHDIFAILLFTVSNIKHHIKTVSYFNYGNYGTGAWKSIA